MLDAWPHAEAERDARYWRLRGRFALDYDRQPAVAVAAFTRAIEELPYDWKSRVRLSRRAPCPRSRGRRARAIRGRRALRELLDPATLGPRLTADLERLDRPAAQLDLADLTARAGLSRLAIAWGAEAESTRTRRHPIIDPA